MGNKLLSLVIPSYNMESYLPKCLESLVSDDKELLQKLDVIIVNDGSKDRTSEIAHGYEANFPGVFRVIDKANGHYGSCVNAGLSIANGKYIKVLDADDSFDGAALSAYLKYLQLQGNAADMIITDFCSVNEYDQEIDRTVHRFPLGQTFGVDVLLNHTQVVVMHAITYRTELLRSICYVQTEGMLYTDGEWCFTPIMYVRDIRYCPIVLYRYLVGRAGQSIATYGRNVAMQVHLLKYMIETYRENAAIVSDVCRHYLERYIKHIAAISYSTYFFKCPINMVNAGVSDIDLYLKQYMPSIYHSIDELSILSNTRFKYHYLRRWRSRGKLPLVQLWFLQMYMRYAPKVRHLVNV